MSSEPSSHDRRLELLAERALFGLSPEDQRELERLGGVIAGDGFELTAAALDVGLHGRSMSEPLPLRLQQATLDAVRQIAGAKTPGADRSVIPGSLETRRAQDARRRDWLGWAVAAASLAVAAFSLTRSPNVAKVTPFELRSELLAAGKRDPGSVFQAAWTKTEDPAAKGAGDRVIWSDKLQRGVIEFTGLEVNDPAKNQYQLWIFDADRPEPTPVDGGVFDIPAGEEAALIPIDAKLPISRATLFAVTVEKPGGAVVSDRSRLPLLAPVPEKK